MILVPCIHFRMYIGTRAENENSDYCYFIYTVIKVLLNIYNIILLSIPMKFPVRLRLHHTHHHSQHTRSGNLQSTDRDQYRQVRLFDTDNGC